MNIFARALRSAAWLELITAASLLVFIVGVILSQVFLRYFWNSPIRWVEEVSVAAMIWLTFLAASLIYKERRHMALWNPATGGRAGISLGLIIDAIVLVTSLYIAWIAFPIVAIENRSVTTSLPFDVPKGFIFSIPVIAGFVSIAATAVYFILEGALRLSGSTTETLSLSPLPPLEDIEEEELA